MSRAFPASMKLSNRGLVIAFIALLFVSAPLSLRAQRREEATPAITYPPQLLSELKQLQQAALSSDYAYRQLAHLTDSIGPRLSGSAQADAAVDYVAGEMRRLGLEVKLEKVTV